MDHQSYAVPDDAPTQLSDLLGRWKSVLKKHLPTPDDLPFDDLVTNFPGLFLVDPSPETERGFDPVFLKVGPECKNRIRKDMEGLPYSKSINPRVMVQVERIYPQILATGEPHYWEITNAMYGAPPQQYHRLLLPLYNSNGNASHLLGICVWTDKLN